MSCLVIKNDGIGDLVLASGIISELSRRYSGNLDLVTCEASRGIPEMIPGIRHIYYISRDDIRISDDDVGCEDKAILLAIASKEYDVAICLRRFIRMSSVIIMGVVSAKEKHCCWQITTNVTRQDAERYSSGWRRYYGDKLVLPEIQYYSSFCASFAGGDFNKMPYLKYEKEKEAYCAGDKVVALGLSGGSAKIEVDLWVKISKLLVEQGWTVHLVGGDDEKKFTAIIRREVPSVVDHIGGFSLKGSPKFLSRYYYYIGNDTGLSHIASLCIPKVLVLLGGGTFPRFFPWLNKKGQYVLYNALDCYDCCWRCKFDSRLCLELLSPESTLEYFNRIVSDEDTPGTYNMGKPGLKYNLLWQSCSHEILEVDFDNIPSLK